MNETDYFRKDPPEVTFVEYHPSRLPYCTSPLLLHRKPKPKSYWIAPHPDILRCIKEKNDFYHYEVWTLEYLKEEFKNAGFSQKLKNPKSFVRSCRLLISKRIAQTQKPLVIITWGAVIRLVAPSLGQELPREILFEKNFFKDSIFEKTFIYFQGGKPFQKDANPILNDISKLIVKTELVSN
ncbi:MAG TPA: hypothetical protein VL576_03385 [Candidatus Paceibacterota bacterium]|jgi:hypothetical protein|nr:hypothetical protein [Candidatus Paceibacterota bacterium]